MHRQLSKPMRRASPAPLMANDDYFVPEVSPPRAWRYQLREVIILGVQGPSGAGKSSLARALCQWLRSPWEPIGTDLYRRHDSNMLCCPHQAPDVGKQWDQEHCFEFPASYDLNLLHDDIGKLRHLTATASGPEPFWLRTPAYGWCALKHTQTLWGSSPMYIIVEGFVLFAEPAIVKQLDVLVWLDIPWELAAERRLRREKKRPDEREEFISTYKDHIHKVERSCRSLYRRNTASREVLHADASRTPAQMLRAILRLLPSNRTQFPMDWNQRPAHNRRRMTSHHSEEPSPARSRVHP